jgi:myo-inositol 2-dehydrogenase/D-chiro-inositol 1-dehydrogenase
MGADHAITLHRWVSGADVSLVADLDLDRARQAADAVSAQATIDPSALIADSAVDAVLIASADSTHPALAREAVRAGKPVLCEKPLAPTLAESLALLNDVGAGGAATISLGFMRRFDPGYVELKQIVHAGRLGQPLLLHSTGRGVTSGPGSTSESIVTNSAVHDLDIIPWLLESPIVEVSWHAPRSTASATAFQDPQLMLLRTADGVLSTVETFVNARYGYDIRCEVVGEHGTASLTEPVRVATDVELHRSTRYAADWRPRFAEAYRLELQAWVDQLNENPAATPLATAQDGLVASAVADAVIDSMHAGGKLTPVRVPDVR